MVKYDGLTTAGTLRAYWLGSVVCLGGFLFGYDSGIIGGVLTLASFERDFHYTAKQSTRISSLAVSLQQLGAFVACFAIWPITHRYGRRPAIVASSIVFCLGALLQTINTHSLAVFYVFRVVAGLGLGASSVTVPMYSSEMSPRQLRGQIGSFYQLFYTFGVFTSYWVNYGVAQDIPKTQSRQWQIPVGLQLIPAALLGLGVFTLKESTRWLTLQGRHDEAWQSLCWIRASDGPAVEGEMEEIRAGVAYEQSAREGFQLKELITVPDHLKRVIGASAMFIAQQATGATAFAYYGPQYFKLLVGNKGNSDLLLTAIFGAIKVIACGTFVIFVGDRFPRRHILAFGGFFMAACQITAAAVLKTHPARGDGTVTSSGIATIALIYLFVMAYNFSWGPLPWPYVSEIFPTRIREPGIGVGVASQWLFNFVFTIATPYMIKSMAWGTFLFWGIADLVIGAGVWALLVETRGRSLEEIAGEATESDAKLYHDGDGDGQPPSFKR
ncbi:MFS sugar transporter-like protein [Myriangium duriaei CBS 260.36]|uniref:MFS sugar transporter-like protein n=1 Tax=Myriangium duriaei CBS 260.36 TaxID=1168546 RepID=A0A9P4JD67_9PEZI|nr:MFS sugar transporter-like protein [Myriangium duriaei CBS 260.36]